MSALRKRSFTEHDKDEFYVLVNKEGKFLNYACSIDEVYYSEIKYAEQFRWDHKKDVIGLIKSYKYNLGVKVKSVEQLAKLLNCEIKKVNVKITTTNSIEFSDL